VSSPATTRYCARVTLAIDFANRQVHTQECSCCGAAIERSSSLVQRDGSAYAVYFASCFAHGAEAFVDVVLGTWSQSGATDHVTFGCRISAVGDTSEPHCSLVTGGEMAVDDALFGAKLSRDDALRHPRLDDFWAIVDCVLAKDPTVRARIYG
jgi:hypothetical protein